MSLIDQLVTGLRAPDGRTSDEIKADIREELEFHLAMAAEENRASGMPGEQAERAAADRFGDLPGIERSCRAIQMGERVFLRRCLTLAVAASLIAVSYASLQLYRHQVRQSAEMTQLRDSLGEMQHHLALMIDRAAPVVVTTFPESGDINVDPSATEIRVTFSKEMMDGSWSWCQTENPFPSSAGPIRFEADGRTCIMPVQLEPGTDYVLGINSQRHRNFRDAYGRSAEPYSLCFTTAAH